MKTIAWWWLAGLLAVPAVFAERNIREDRTVDPALLTWSEPGAWQAGVVYTHLSRLVDLDGLPQDLKGDIYDGAVGFSPLPWLLLYGQAGASQARLEGSMRADTATGGGGLAGMRINLWQLFEGEQKTAWRLLLQVAGQYAYRTTSDDGEGELQWSETLAMLPLTYHLSFARTFRNYYMSEFQSLAVYAGPAVSLLDGTWTRNGVERDFEQADEFGLVGGVDFWLLESLGFGLRADWFEDATSMQAVVRYRF